MGFQVEVILATHSGCAFDDVVTLPRLKAGIHIAIINTVAPALQPSLHAHLRHPPCY